MYWPAILQLIFLVLLLASPGPCRSHKITVQSSVGKHLSSSTQGLYPRDRGHKAHRKGKLPVIRQPEYLWQLAMHVGGQHERLVVDIDTGSASLIVQRGSYHPGPTAKNLHRETKLAFGEGTDNFSFKAHLYEDFVQLGPLTGRAGVQRIVGPHNEDLSVSDGLVGLCRSGYNNDDVGFLQSIRNSKNWNGIFTTDFRIDGGWIDFASPVKDRDYSGELVWLPLLNEAAFSSNFPFWDVAGQLGDVSFNATIDSGTYGIALPGRTFDQIIAKYPHHLEVVLDQETGASYMLGDCDWTPSSLPFRFVGDNGHIFEVSMSPTAFWLSGPAKDQPSKCYGAIVGEVGVGEDSPWIIGASIFLSSVIVHDMDGKRLGFAHKNTDLLLDSRVYNDVVQIGPLSGRSQIAHIVAPKDGYVGANEGLLGLCSKTMQPKKMDPKIDVGFLSSMRETSHWSGTFTLDLRDRGGMMGFEKPSRLHHHQRKLIWSSVPKVNTTWNINGRLGDVGFSGFLDSASAGTYMPLVHFQHIASRYPEFSVHVDHSDGTHYMVGPCSWIPKHSLPLSLVGDDGDSMQFSMTAAAFWSNGEIQGRPGKCLSGIVGQEGSADLEPWALGAPVFLSTWLAFDVANQKIGVGHKLHHHRKGRPLI